MHASLLAAETQLDDLRNFTRFLDAGYGLQSGTLLPASESDGMLRDLQVMSRSVSAAAARTLSYNVLIISTYGVLEHFMEQIVIAYVELLNEICPRYTDLPTAIRDAHVVCTMDFARRLDETRVSTLTDAETLVGNLHSCLADLDGYKVNALAFASHTANFRSGVAQAFLGRIGIQNAAKWILADQSYRSACSALDPEGGASFTRFDDLVDRRNEVAHGAQPTQLLALELLRAYVELVRGFARAVYRCARAAAIDAVRINHGQLLGRPLGVYRGGRIITLDFTSGRVEPGDVLVARRQSGLCTAAEIESLMVNDAPVGAAEVSGDDAIPLGLGLTGAVRASFELWLVRRAAFEPVGWHEPSR